MTLLETDVLVLRQIRVIARNDFTIRDGRGQAVGTVRTEGSIAGRLFMGPRELTVSDADGRTVLRLKDKIGIGRDRMDIFDARGSSAGELARRFTLIRRACWVDLPGGSRMEITGSFTGFNYAVTEGPAQLASVSRRYEGLGDFLLDRDSYVLQIAPDVPPAKRVAIIGAVIGVDLMAQKDKSNN